MVSCILKGFLDPVRFHFQDGVSFFTYHHAPLSLAIFSQASVPGLALVTSFFFFSFEQIIQTTAPAVQPSDSCKSCVAENGVYVDKCD